VAKSRPHTALVYFGLAADPEENARLRDTPMNVWRIAAIAVPLCLLGGLALGALWLIGVEVTWGTAIAVLTILGLVSSTTSLADRFRPRRSAD
jgi:hypothetical protein